MKKWILTLCAVATLSLTQMATAASSDISSFFRELKTFSANFTQTVKQEGKIVQQSSGKVQLKKPLKFRWDYQSPEKMQLISDGNRFYHYDIELAQATVKPAKEVTDSALSTLLSDKEDLDKLFSIKSFAAPAVKARFPKQAKQWLAKADLFYQLRPKQTQNAVAKNVILGFDNRRQLTLFYVQDDFGENTFFFENAQQNKTISDSSFVFKAPKSVDVLGQ